MTRRPFAIARRPAPQPRPAGMPSCLVEDRGFGIFAQATRPPSNGDPDPQAA
jgi:hypothetical protein